MSAITCLIIDDEPTVSRSLARLFRALGCNVVSSGPDPNFAGVLAALNWIQPDIVVSDFDLGWNRCTGCDVLELAKRASVRVLHSGSFDAVCSYADFQIAKGSDPKWVTEVLDAAATKARRT